MNIEQHSTDKSEEIISKSQIKRECHERQDLGELLVKLPVSKLRVLIAEQSLLDALIEAQKIYAYSAQKRMKKRIGKLIGKLSETEQQQIERYFDQKFQKKQQNDAHFHLLEQWRDRLLAEGDKAINDLLEHHSQFDRGHLRQLIRNAQKERQLDKPPKSARQIFAYLKEQM